MDTVHDSRELLPWVLTFRSRDVSLICETGTCGVTYEFAGGGSKKLEVFQCAEDAVFVTVRGDIICGGFTFRCAVVHGNADAGGLEHFNVILGISEGNDLGGI